MTLFLCSGCKPRVSFTSPVDGATEVQGHADITAYFNMRIDNTTLDMTLECDASPVAGSVEIITAASGRVDRAVFTPVAYLHSGSTCTATIGAGLKSHDSNSVMNRDYSWKFTVDTVAPEITSMTESSTRSPGTLVPVIMHFNEPIGSIDYSFSTAHLSPVYSNNRKTVTVRALSLTSGNIYTFSLTGFEDTAGNHVVTDREVVLTVQ